MTSTVLDSNVLRTSFRRSMGNVAAAVSVVTVLHEGRPHGTTVSAFCSLSMEPPMLLVSLDERSSLLSKLTIGSVVGVNVLAAHQDQVALRFASKNDEKFTDIPWRVEDGAPALIERHSRVVMTVNALVEAGDHTLVLGDVLAADASSNAPLTYWQRAFGTHKTF